MKGNNGSQLRDATRAVPPAAKAFRWDEAKTQALVNLAKSDPSYLILFASSQDGQTRERSAASFQLIIRFFERADKSWLGDMAKRGLIEKDGESGWRRTEAWLGTKQMENNPVMVKIKTLRKKYQELVDQGVAQEWSSWDDAPKSRHTTGQMQCPLFFELRKLYNSAESIVLRTPARADDHGAGDGSGAGSDASAPPAESPSRRFGKATVRTQPQLAAASSPQSILNYTTPIPASIPKPPRRLPSFKKIGQVDVPPSPTAIPPESPLSPLDRKVFLPMPKSEAPGEVFQKAVLEDLFCSSPSYPLLKSEPAETKPEMWDIKPDPGLVCSIMRESPLGPWDPNPAKPQGSRQERDTKPELAAKVEPTLEDLFRDSSEEPEEEEPEQEETEPQFPLQPEPASRQASCLPDIVEAEVERYIHSIDWSHLPTNVFLLDALHTDVRVRSALLPDLYPAEQIVFGKLKRKEEWKVLRDLYVTIVESCPGGREWIELAEGWRWIGYKELPEKSGKGEKAKPKEKLKATMDWPRGVEYGFSERLEELSDAWARGTFERDVGDALPARVDGKSWSDIMHGIFGASEARSTPARSSPAIALGTEWSDDGMSALGSPRSDAPLAPSLRQLLEIALPVPAIDPALDFRLPSQPAGGAYLHSPLRSPSPIKIKQSPQAVAGPSAHPTPSTYNAEPTLKRRRSLSPLRQRSPVPRMRQTSYHEENRTSYTEHQLPSPPPSHHGDGYRDRRLSSRDDDDASPRSHHREEGLPERYLAASTYRPAPSPSKDGDTGAQTSPIINPAESSTHRSRPRSRSVSSSPARSHDGGARWRPAARSYRQWWDIIDFASRRSFRVRDLPTRWLKLYDAAEDEDLEEDYFELGRAEIYMEGIMGACATKKTRPWKSYHYVTTDDGHIPSRQIRDMLQDLVLETGGHAELQNRGKRDCKTYLFEIQLYEERGQRKDMASLKKGVIHRVGLKEYLDEVARVCA